jgi:hypothetical protein
MWSRQSTEFDASVVLARQCTLRVVVELAIRLRPARYTDVQGLQTHQTLLTDDSTSTGLYRDQVIPYLIVHV